MLKEAKTTGMANMSVGETGKNGNPSNPQEKTISYISARLPFHKDFFVGRGNEARAISDSVALADRGRIERPIVEIVGPVGLGKTWLLKRLAADYSLDSEPSEETRRKTFSAYVDLADLEEWNGQDYWWYHHFLRILVSALPKQLESFPPELDALRDSIPQVPLAPDQLNRTLGKLGVWLEGLLTKNLPVLVFDSTEKADLAHLNWLEREILVPLAQKRNSLIIVAGRRPVVWREPEIRFHLDLRELGPLLDEDSTWTRQAVLYRNQTIRVPRLIHERYTLGHPGVAAALVTRLLQRGVRVSDDSLRGPQVEQDVIPSAFADAVFAEHDSLLEGVRHDLHPLLRSVCALRLFNATSLQTFAAAFSDRESDKNQSRVFFRQSIREMIEDNVVQWTAALSDYGLIPIVRRVLANVVRVTEGQERFRQRHQTARGMYMDRLGDESTNAPWTVPEILYHTAMLARIDGQAEPGEQAISSLEELQDGLLTRLTYKTADDLVNRMKNTGGDRDLDELQRDLVELVGKATLNEIIRKSEVFRDALPQE